MLPKGHQALLFLRETQTVLITNRPRSSLFSAGTGVSFALPTTHTLKEKNGEFCLSVHLTFVMPCEHHQLKFGNEGIWSLLWESDQDKEQAQRVGKGTLCRLWSSREVQPLFESWFKGVDCHSSWLLTAVSHHKPTWHQREKDEQENGSLNVCVATVLVLVLISPLCVCMSYQTRTHTWLTEWVEEGKYHTALLSWHVHLKFL